MKFYFFYSRLPHPHALRFRFRVRMFRMHGPQWNNIKIILTVVEEYWIGDGDLRSVVDEVYDTSARLPGLEVEGYWCMWGWRFILAKMIGIKNNKIRIKY